MGTAGSVSTGAVDPLRDIAAVCKEYDIWFHVDGAYGGFAAAVPDASDDLRALSDADSVAVDPHKWLYAPLEAGCALVRDSEALRAAVQVAGDIPVVAIGGISPEHARDIYGVGASSICAISSVNAAKDPVAAALSLGNIAEKSSV